MPLRIPHPWYAKMIRLLPHDVQQHKACATHSMRCRACGPWGEQLGGALIKDDVPPSHGDCGRMCTTPYRPAVQPPIHVTSIQPIPTFGQRDSRGAPLRINTWPEPPYTWPQTPLAQGLPSPNGLCRGSCTQGMSEDPATSSPGEGELPD